MTGTQVTVTTEDTRGQNITVTKSKPLPKSESNATNEYKGPPIPMVHIVEPEATRVPKKYSYREMLALNTPKVATKEGKERARLIAEREVDEFIPLSSDRLNEFLRLMDQYESKGYTPKIDTAESYLTPNRQYIKHRIRLTKPERLLKAELKQAGDRGEAEYLEDIEKREAKRIEERDRVAAKLKVDREKREAEDQLIKSAGL